jgi:hypothetical protein
MSYPRLNHNLLFHSDDATKFKLIAEIAQYCNDKHIGLATLDNYMYLIRLISNPVYRARQFALIRGEERDPLLALKKVQQVFTTHQVIMHQLASIARLNKNNNGGYELLGLVYLRPDQIDPANPTT